MKISESLFFQLLKALEDLVCVTELDESISSTSAFINAEAVIAKAKETSKNDE